MSRTMPTYCRHGRVVDWGDFGPDPDDPTADVDRCVWCENPLTWVDRHGPAVLSRMGQVMAGAASALCLASLVGLLRDPNLGWLMALAANTFITWLGWSFVRDAEEDQEFNQRMYGEEEQ